MKSKGRGSPFWDKVAAAIYAAGEQGQSFTLPALAGRLGLKGKDRERLANLLLSWFKQERLERLPTVGPILYQVRKEALESFKPPPPPPPPPPPAPVAAPADNRGIVGALQDLRQPPPASFDALLRSWLAGQLAPYGQMLQAAVAEIEHLRRDMATVMEVLTKPEGDRPALPPRPELKLSETNGTPVVQAPVPGYPFATERMLVPRRPEDSALAIIVQRLDPQWHVSPAACETFEELDALTKQRVLRALKQAASGTGNWPHLGKQYETNGIPHALRAPGTWWAFKAGKKERVMIRRNGPTVTVEALVKRNDHRWYQSA